MKEKLKIIITTKDGETIMDTVPSSVLERLKLQKQMLEEIGEGGAYPMMETSKGEYVIVKDVVVL